MSCYFIEMQTQCESIYTRQPTQNRELYFYKFSDVLSIIHPIPSRMIITGDFLAVFWQSCSVKRDEFYTCGMLYGFYTSQK